MTTHAESVVGPVAWVLLTNYDKKLYFRNTLCTKYGYQNTQIHAYNYVHIDDKLLRII